MGQSHGLNNIVVFPGTVLIGMVDSFGGRVVLIVRIGIGSWRYGG